jgi:hypothetical protein
VFQSLKNYDFRLLKKWLKIALEFTQIHSRGNIEWGVRWAILTGRQRRQRQDHLQGRSFTTPKVAQLTQLTPSPPIIEYYSPLHHYNRLLKLYTMVLILVDFIMATATNSDLFFIASDSALYNRFKSFKDEI